MKFSTVNFKHSGFWRGEVYEGYKVGSMMLDVEVTYNQFIGCFRSWFQACPDENITCCVSFSGSVQPVLTDSDVSWFFKVHELIGSDGCLLIVHLGNYLLPINDAEDGNGERACHDVLSSMCTVDLNEVPHRNNTNREHGMERTECCVDRSNSRELVHFGAGACLSTVGGKAGPSICRLLGMVGDDEGSISQKLDNLADFCDVFADVETMLSKGKLLGKVVFESNSVVGVNDMFEGKRDMKLWLHANAIKNNFQFRTVRSSSSRYELRCVDEKCSWRFRARNIKGSNVWVVMKYLSEHSCTIDGIAHEHRQAVPNIISEYVRTSFRDFNVDGMKPKEIVSFMRQKYGIKVSYYKAWRAREVTLTEIYGSPEESYSRLPAFSYMIQKENPGTYVQWEVDKEDRFKYYFIAYGASRNGWKACRPIINVDGTFLKHKYAGILIIATSIDGNNQTFPLAFSVVDSENDAAWTWFFSCLKTAYLLGDDICIISDRHRSIRRAVLEVFPYAHHGYCIYHLASNITLKFKKKQISHLFMRAAKAYRKDECLHYMDTMESICPGIKQYLGEVGMGCWARSFFPGCRFNVMTTNIAESFNSRIRMARKLPIIPLLLEIRDILQKWFFDRRTLGSMFPTPITTWAEGCLKKEIDGGCRLLVKSIDVHSFEVVEAKTSFVVNHESLTCSCCKWQLEKLPCSHACASFLFSRKSPYMFIPAYFTKESYLATYEMPIFRIVAWRDWVIPENVGNELILPPNVRRHVGRPRINRLRSVLENKR